MSHTKKKTTLETKIHETLEHFRDKKPGSEWTKEDHEKAKDLATWGAQATTVVEHAVKVMETNDPGQPVISQLKSLLSTGKARPRWWK